MNEFEKWFKKNKPYESYSCMDMAEKAWEAALKWILRQSNIYRPAQKPDDWGSDLLDDIQQELISGD